MSTKIGYVKLSNSATYIPVFKDGTPEFDEVEFLDVSGIPELTINSDYVDYFIVNEYKRVELISRYFPNTYESLVTINKFNILSGTSLALNDSIEIPEEYVELYESIIRATQVNFVLDGSPKFNFTFLYNTTLGSTIYYGDNYPVDASEKNNYRVAFYVDYNENKVSYMEAIPGQNYWSGSVLTYMLDTATSVPITPEEFLTVYKIYENAPVYEHIRISPQIPYIKSGEVIEFKLLSGDIDVTSDATWGLGVNTIETEFTELNGYKIENNTLSCDDPTSSFIIVSAKVGGKGAYTTVYLYDYKGTYLQGGIVGINGQTQIGGGGSYGRLPDGSIEPSDTIDIPAGTVASPATATGFFTRYLADTNTISTFGQWLWTTDLGLQVAKAVISLIYGDPAQSVISLMSYPFNISTLPGVLQSTGNIVWGNFNSGISSDILNSQASQIDWGTIQLNEYWGNFLDYAPHTKVSLYLPWGTGFVDLDPGECLPGTLNVKTNIDFSKGSCVHNVFGNGNLIGSFAGQCAQQIPVLSSDFASKVAGLVTAAAAGISASAVGGAGVLAEAAMGFPNATISGGDDKVLASFSDAKRAAGRIATTSLAINRHPVHITRNGGFTDGSAALGCQYPYVIVSRPKQSMPEQYGSHFGYPSNIYRQLGTLRGYTEVGEIHLEGIPATDAELSELDRILKGGVIF